MEMGIPIRNWGLRTPPMHCIAWLGGVATNWIKKRLTYFGINSGLGMGFGLGLVYHQSPPFTSSDIRALYRLITTL